MRWHDLGFDSALAGTPGRSPRQPRVSAARYAFGVSQSPGTYGARHDVFLSALTGCGLPAVSRTDINAGYRCRTRRSRRSDCATPATRSDPVRCTGSPAYRRCGSPSAPLEPRCRTAPRRRAGRYCPFVAGTVPVAETHAADLGVSDGLHSVGGGAYRGWCLKTSPNSSPPARSSASRRASRPSRPASPRPKLAITPAADHRRNCSIKTLRSCGSRGAPMVLGRSRAGRIFCHRSGTGRPLLPFAPRSSCCSPPGPADTPRDGAGHIRMNFAGPDVRLQKVAILFRADYGSEASSSTPFGVGVSGSSTAEFSAAVTLREAPQIGRLDLPVSSVCERVRWARMATVGNARRWTVDRARPCVGVIRVRSGAVGPLLGDRWEALALVGDRWWVPWSPSPS